MPQELVDFSTPKKVIKPPTQEEMSDFFAQLRKQFES